MIVWAAVGILAVLFVVFMVASARAAGPRGKVTLSGIGREVSRVERSIEDLAAELGRVRANSASAPYAESLGIAEQKLNIVRDELPKVKDAKSAVDANRRLQAARDRLDEVRRILNRAAKTRPPTP
jgi:hypothetical protein